jgi:hypothetical protein
MFLVIANNIIFAAHTGPFESYAGAAGFTSPQRGEVGERSEPGEGELLSRASAPPSPQPSPPIGRGSAAEQAAISSFELARAE